MMSEITSKHSVYDVNICDVNISNKADLDLVIDLHLNLLSWGPIARMGRRFLKYVAYILPMKEGSIKVVLYKVNDIPAGFIVYTSDSSGFYTKAIKNHFMFISFIALISFLENPTHLIRFVKVALLILTRREEKKMGKDYSSEIIAIGVKPEYRDHRFIRKSGIRISHELFLHAVKYFKSIGLEKMRLVVDKFNTETLFFYQGLGGIIESYKRHGNQMYQIWFDLNKIDADFHK
jgi:ribosomal protein S18 acetylase RimI-like enzyme